MLKEQKLKELPIRETSFYRDLFSMCLLSNLIIPCKGQRQGIFFCFFLGTSEPASFRVSDILRMWFSHCVSSTVMHGRVFILEAINL